MPFIPLHWLEPNIPKAVKVTQSDEKVAVYSKGSKKPVYYLS